MKNIIIISIILLNINYLHTQGIKLATPEKINSFKKFSTQSFGFSSDIPTRYSMQKYVPPVADQEGSTCVGFSSLYYALSTMYNIEFEYTSYQDRWTNAFDPYFLYSIMNNYTDESCEEGLYVDEAIEKIIEFGAKKRWIFPITSCNTDWTSNELIRVKEYTYPYRISDFYYFSPEEVNDIKKAVYYDMPITVGFKLTDSFDDLMKSGNTSSNSTYSSLWNPQSWEEVTGVHAMTIVGYDDSKYGGAFLVVNSWGKEFGDDGYVWIKYSDFKKYSREAYAFDVEFGKNFNYEFDDFERYGIKSGLYEGEYIDDKLNGYGSWYSKENKTYYLGYLKDGSWDGFHVIISPDEMKWGEFENGNFVEFGFVGESENEKKLKEHLNKFDFNLNVKKANSKDVIKIPSFN